MEDLKPRPFRFGQPKDQVDADRATLLDVVQDALAEYALDEGLMHPEIVEGEVLIETPQAPFAISVRAI